MCAKAEACFKLKLRDKQIGLFHKRLRLCLSVKYPGCGNLPRTFSLIFIVLCELGKRHVHPSQEIKGCLLVAAKKAGAPGLCKSSFQGDTCILGIGRGSITHV